MTTTDIDTDPAIPDPPDPLRIRAGDADLKMVRIFHLDMMAFGLDDLFEFLSEDCDMAVVKELFPNASDERLERLLDDREDMEDVFAWTPPDHSLGWIIECSTPRKVKMDRGGLMYSWGDCWLKQFYAPTYREALDKAFTWAAEMDQEAKDGGNGTIGTGKGSGGGKASGGGNGDGGDDGGHGGEEGVAGP